jgi:5'(3')-deoxyribonucleotidase
MRVFLDMDETLVNLVDPWLGYLNAFNDTSVTREDTTAYSVEKTFTWLTNDQIFGPFITPGFWKDLPPFPGAIEFVRRLVDSDYDVYLATSPARGPTCAPEKEQWVMDHLPFLGRERLILCHHKYLLRGDFMMDDNPKYLCRFKGRRLLFDKPWNHPEELDRQKLQDHWFVRIHSYDSAFSFMQQTELPF